MDTCEAKLTAGEWRVRICRPAFQDLRYLVMPRLAARAQFRRHAMKLRFWKRGDPRVADLECVQIPDSGLFVAKLADGFGLAEGFNLVFREESNLHFGGTLCVLCVMKTDEPISAAMLDILRGREVVARERLRRWPTDA